MLCPMKQLVACCVYTLFSSFSLYLSCLSMCLLISYSRVQRKSPFASISRLLLLATTKGRMTTLSGTRHPPLLWLVGIGFSPPFLLSLHTHKHTSCRVRAKNKAETEQGTAFEHVYTFPLAAFPASENQNIHQADKKIARANIGNAHKGHAAHIQTILALEEDAGSSAVMMHPRHFAFPVVYFKTHDGITRYAGRSWRVRSFHTAGKHGKRKQ